MSTHVGRLSAIAAIIALAGGIVAPAGAQKGVDGQPTKPFFIWTLAEQKALFPAIEKTYQTATIEKGDTVRALPSHSQAISPRISHGGRTFGISDFMAATGISGVIAFSDGKVVLEKYAQGRSSQDRWPSTGLAKAMTSTLIGAAIKDRWIRSEYDPVQRYLLDLEDTVYEDVSIRRLMSMSSGVKWNGSFTVRSSDELKLASAPYSRGAVHPTVAFAATLNRESEPGQQHAYKTVDADLAGLALSSALAGKTLSQYASEKIWAPYGMESDALWAVDATGKEKASGPLSLTLRDAARFGQFLLDDGEINGRKVLPAGWIAEATSNQLNAGAPNRAGYFFMPSADGSFEANGFFGQGFYVNPAEKLVVVVNAVSASPNDAAQNAARATVVNSIREALSVR